MNERMGIRPVSQVEAIAAIHAWRAQLQAEGAVDTEEGWVRQMSQNVERGMVSPDEALRQLQVKMASRQDYH